jgi:PAS domain S-box-containing protein
MDLQNDDMRSRRTLGMDSSPTPYQTIIENFPVGIVFLYEERDDLRYTFVGGEGLSEIGLTKANLEGHIVAENRPPDIKDQIHSQYRKALNGEHVTFETEAEGRHFRFHLRPVRDETDTITGGAGFAQDITEQVMYREELERQNERLDGLTQLVFHDIQSPLNVAKGHLNLLQEERESEHIEPIVDALERIGSLTSEDTSPIEEQTIGSIEEVALDTVVQAAWRNVATKSATLRIETDRAVCGNSADMRRLFENLFRNAVEHGGEDVTITVGNLDTGFYVADDGSGIPSEDRERLFERGVSGSEQGTGLGLFIVKRVADAHDWTLSVTESDTGGARFELTNVHTSC